MRSVLTLLVFTALVGCSYLDYYTPDENPEANFLRTVAAIHTGNPARHDLHPIDREEFSNRHAARAENLGFRLFASTAQGSAIDRSNVHDLLSTGVALTANTGATEANPLGLALLPLKIGMGWLVDRSLDECYDRVKVASLANPLFNGAAVNNWVIALGGTSSVALPLGVLGGVLFYVFRTSVEPGVYTCPPKGTQTH